MTRASLRALLRRAARLLEVEATELRRSCAIGAEPWVCPDCTGSCATRRLHDRYMATARELKSAAAKGIRQ